MSEERPPITTQTAQDSAVHKVLGDGTVLYKTWQQAEAARLQKKTEQQQSGTTVSKLSQAKYGQQYLAHDGKAAPYTLGNLVEFQFTGLIVVIVVLAGLSIICSLIGRLLMSLSKPATVTAVSAPVTVTPAAPVNVGNGIHPGLTDQQLVVLLTAAATEMVGESVRVEKFRPLTSKDLNWAAQGRSELQSHRLK